MDEDYNKVVNILFNIIKVNPEERLLADSCLERGCYNSLFKKTHDGHIMGANDIEVNTLEDTTSQAKEAEEADDKTKTPTLQLPQWTEVGINNTSFLVNFWGSIDGNKAGLINSPSTIKGSISKTPARRPPIGLS